MRQWDIFLFPFTEEQPHPVVILSIDERAAARKHVNGLLCVTLRGRPLERFNKNCSRKRQTNRARL